MNLVEATVEDGHVNFGQFSLSVPSPLRPPDGPVILGIRPESFEDAALAPELPSLEVVVEVLEDLGSDAHVFFTVEARSITAEVLAADDEGGRPRSAVPSSPPASACAPRPTSASASRSRSTRSASSSSTPRPGSASCRRPSSRTRKAVTLSA